MKSIEIKLVQIVERRFPAAAADFGNASEFAAVGLDSLDLVDLIWEIETAFGITLEDKDLHELRRPSDLVPLIAARCALA